MMAAGDGGRYEGYSVAELESMIEAFEKALQGPEANDDEKKRLRGEIERIKQIKQIKQIKAEQVSIQNHQAEATAGHPSQALSGVASQPQVGISATPSRQGNKLNLKSSWPSNLLRNMSSGISGGFSPGQQSQHRKILLLILDYDGCFGAKQTDIISHNQEILDRIVDKIKLGGYTKVIIMVGSDRQTLEVDVNNAATKANGLAALGLKEIADYLRKHCPGVSIEFSSLLLADMYRHQYKPGYTHKQIIKHGPKTLKITSAAEQRNKIYSFQEHQKNIVHERGACFTQSFRQHQQSARVDDSPSFILMEKSKFIMTYVFTHYIAGQHPNSKIHTWFFDDREDILQGTLGSPNSRGLKQYFESATQLLPHNVASMCLFRYLNYPQTELHQAERILPNLDHPTANISGSGPINFQLLTTLRNMAEVFFKQSVFTDYTSDKFKLSQGNWQNCERFTSDWAYQYLLNALNPITES